jgi:carbonic anhydrase
VQDVRLKHQARIDALAREAQSDRLCELNVIEQAINVCQTTVIQEAWARGQPVSVRGWIYSLADGRIRCLKTVADAPDELVATYESALAALC